MNLRRAIQRHDHFIRAFDNARGIAFQQQAGAQDGGAYAAIAQQRRKAEQVRVHQRLSAREHHPFDAEAFDIRQVPFQFGGADLLRLGELPDVAHDAAAVAAIVRLQHQDRQDAPAALSCEDPFAREAQFLAQVFRRGAAQLADVGIHQHGRAAFDVQQLEAAALGEREVGAPDPGRSGGCGPPPPPARPLRRTAPRPEFEPPCGQRSNLRRDLARRRIRAGPLVTIS